MSLELQSGPDLGVCYYPEQWPEEKWAEDARQMVELGLSWVRIGEFAWAMIEPAPGQFDWGWLDRAIETLGAAGLKVIMSTPTAAPPKWLVDLYPEILPVGADGQVRKFGARRHYCFSSPRYLAEATRIANAVGARYGRNPHVRAWQVDNEYGDHDTIHSWSDAALTAFRQWLGKRYGTIDGLNRAWGTSFWSMRYNSFDEVELPNQIVDEPSPTHLLDFRRFSSDQVLRFHRAQVEILREMAPGLPITHNFMNQHIDFDHHGISPDIDVASWDVYPLGNLIHGRLPQGEKERLLRRGDPDQPSFNHDLYRGVGKGRVWVMEQQPGPVNWAMQNQAPMDGMIRLWTWLAFAHGCEMVAYFRWRQVPFAQEQFHSGLQLPDGTPDQAYHEVASIAREMASLPKVGPRGRAEVALVLDYPSRWALQCLPQGRNFDPPGQALDWYSTLRRLGVDVDIISQQAPLNGYKLIVAPDLLIPDDGFVDRVLGSQAKVLLGPRSGSKTADMHIPDALPPGPLRRLIDLRVIRVESLPDWQDEPVRFGEHVFFGGRWRETIESSARVIGRFEGTYRRDAPAFIENDRCRYLATLPDPDGLRLVLENTLDWAGVPHLADLGDLRLARRDQVTFAFNFGYAAVEAPAGEAARFVLGKRLVQPCDVAAWVEVD